VITVPHKVRYTYQEYVSFESGSNVKHEFLDGEIYAMAGGTPEHAALAASFIGSIAPQLRGGPCRVYTSDLRIRTASGLSTYPDVSVICGPPQLESHGDSESATNPIILVEVLSRSTEEWDREGKFEHYKSLSSLRQYILVSHRERSVEIWTNDREQGWKRETAREGDVVDLVLGVHLNVRELYDAAGVLTR
jgi:Uma2 family endonuclease